MKQGLSLFLKGILMGICDVIPGISGGTIAFITGIYSRLINAVKGFSPKLAADFLNYVLRRDKKSFLEDVKGLDLGFLIILGFSLFLSSKLSCAFFRIFRTTCINSLS